MRITAAVALGCVVCVMSAGHARQDPAQPRPRFRTGVALIEVDVSVLDRNRRPVRGLSAADFTILEEGKPQSIVTFTEIEVRDPEPPTSSWMREVASDVRTNTDATDRRLMVLVLDDAQVRREPRMQQNVKAILAAASSSGWGPAISRR